MSSGAAALRALHVPGDPLVLPNAWDAASARAVAAAGFPAVATGSAAVAAALGYGDHEAAPADEMFAAVARVARAVDVPVTADVERGYGLPPREIVEQLAQAGAVGCNLEDTDHRTGLPVEADEQAAFLAEVRAAAGDALVLNARVDTLLVDGGTAEAVRRARLYATAGADCVYPIGRLSEPVIAELAAEIPAPINVMCTPDSPPLARLAELGVARVSYAANVFRAVQNHLSALLADIRTGGSPLAG